MCSMPLRCLRSDCSPSAPIAASCARSAACSPALIGCTCSICSSGVPNAAVPAICANARAQCGRSRRRARLSRPSASSAWIARSNTMTTSGARRSRRRPSCAPPQSRLPPWCKMSDDRSIAPAGPPDFGRVGSRLTRRRALRIVAAMAGLPMMIAALRAAAPKGQLHSWQGDVLGGVAELTLWHPDAAFARRSILRVRHEIERLERIFSLYRQDSEISRLNAAGRLRKPSPELHQLVEESQRLGALSGGAFDISVQPLWRLYEAHFWLQTDVQPDIAARARAVAQASVDFRQIDSSAASIGFARAGMAITLNSI